MAEQVDVVKLLADSVGQMNRTTNLATNAVAQGLPAIAANFDGSDPKKFKNWIKSIEKYVDPNRQVLIAYQTSSGPVSDCLYRYN